MPRSPPTRISYRHALQFLRLFWLKAWTTSPGMLPRPLDALHDELALLILPPRRPHRRYARVVIGEPPLLVTIVTRDRRVPDNAMAAGYRVE